MCWFCPGDKTDPHVRSPYLAPHTSLPIPRSPYLAVLCSCRRYTGRLVAARWQRSAAASSPGREGEGSTAGVNSVCGGGEEERFGAALLVLTVCVGGRRRRRRGEERRGEQLHTQTGL